jgi:hypothetical protein
MTITNTALIVSNRFGIPTMGASVVVVLLIVRVAVLMIPKNVFTAA